MSRLLIVFIAAITLAVPAPVWAQSSADVVRERAQEARERAQERTQEAADRALEKALQRQERGRAGTLDTVVAFDAHGTISLSCPGGAVIVTGAERNEIRVRARTENGAIRFTSNGTRASLEPASGRGCSDGQFEMTVPVGTKVVARTWSGSVSVRGVHGDIDAHSQSGDVAGSRCGRPSRY